MKFNYALAIAVHWFCGCAEPVHVVDDENPAWYYAAEQGRQRRASGASLDEVTADLRGKPWHWRGATWVYDGRKSTLPGKRSARREIWLRAVKFRSLSEAKKPPLSVSVYSDGDMADLYERVVGRKHPALKGKVTDTYLDFFK